MGGGLALNPFYFGSGERRLFGLYNPGGARAARAFVLCHPWGHEYQRAHRSMRHLATLLSRGGAHVLRFDYYGTGDSAGDLADADLEGWRGDIETAIEELRDTSGAERVGLIGLRVGATLAASVAARRRDDVDTLVLWDPIVDGPAYVNDLLQHGWRNGSGVEVQGYTLTSAMAAAMRTLDLKALAPALPARTLAMITAAPPAHHEVRAALGGAVPIEELPADSAWVKEANTGVGALPVKVLQRIVEWLG